jgi:hypothetical protein
MQQMTIAIKRARICQSPKIAQATQSDPLDLDRQLPRFRIAKTPSKPRSALTKIPESRCLNSGQQQTKKTKGAGGQKVPPILWPFSGNMNRQKD